METILTVTSLDSIERFPDNTVAQFRSFVDLQLDPTQSYEVALYQISFVKSWYNFPADKEYWMEYRSPDANEEPNRLDIPPNYYTKQLFEQTIDKFTSAHEPWHRPDEASPYVHRRIATIHYDVNQARFDLTFKMIEIVDTPERVNVEEVVPKQKDRVLIPWDTVRMSRDLAVKCGFLPANTTEKYCDFVWNNGGNEQVFHSSYPIDWYEHDFFFLQTSIMEPAHNIGGDLKQMMAFVPLDTTVEWGNRVTYIPPKEIWFPLNRTEKHPQFVFSSATGQLLPFTHGTSSATLRIRPKKHV